MPIPQPSPSPQDPQYPSLQILPYTTRGLSQYTWPKPQPPQLHLTAPATSGSRFSTSGLPSREEHGICSVSIHSQSEFQFFFFKLLSTDTWDNAEKYTFNLPKCIPNGDYLLRIQSLAIHNPWPAGIPQFFIECAQITVTGGGSTNLGPKVAIPGAFKATDPGYTANIYNNFNSYTVPGPAVATC